MLCQILQTTLCGPAAAPPMAPGQGQEFSPCARNCCTQRVALKGSWSSWAEAGFANTSLIDFKAWKSALENINCFLICFFGGPHFLLSNFTKANPQICFPKALFKTFSIQRQNSKSFLCRYLLYLCFLMKQLYDSLCSVVNLNCPPGICVKKR